MWWEQGGFLLAATCSLSPPQVSLEPLAMGGGAEGGLVSGGSAVGLSTGGEAAGRAAEGRKPVESDGSWKLELRSSGAGGGRQSWTFRERLVSPRWEMKRQSLHGGAEGRPGCPVRRETGTSQDSAEADGGTQRRLLGPAGAGAGAGRGDGSCRAQSGRREGTGTRSVTQVPGVCRAPATRCPKESLWRSHRQARKPPRSAHVWPAGPFPRQPQMCSLPLYLTEFLPRRVSGQGDPYLAATP